MVLDFMTINNDYLYYIVTVFTNKMLLAGLTEIQNDKIQQLRRQW